MTDMLDLDIEEAIPASQIITRKHTIIKRQIGSENDDVFEDIIVTDDENDSVEYIEVVYLDDENLSNENISNENLSNENLSNENLSNEIISNEHIKLEPESDESIGKDNNEDSQEKIKQLFHCDSCDIQFTSIDDHLNEFHKDQTVLLDFPDDQDETENSKSDKTNEIKYEVNDDIKLEYMGDSILEEDIEYYIEPESNYASMDGEREIDDDDTVNFIKKELLSPELTVESTEVNECGHCETIFLTLEGFQNHKCADARKNKAIANDDDETVIICYKCRECNQDFYSARSLATHMRGHKIPAKSNKNEAKDKKNISTLCTECNTTFPSVKSLKLHMRMHDPIKVKHLEDAVSHELKACAKDKNVRKETFFCAECDKSYDKVFEEIHQRAHSTEATNICSVCNKKFANQMNLTMHLQAHQDHTKLKGPTKAEAKGVTLPYPCVYCGRQFARPHEKVKHERIHTGEKPYKCEICGKSFRVSYCLTLHLRTHTGARPYVCPHCNKRFKAYSVYNHHLMTHSDERPYKCPYCPKAFKTSVQLGGHKKGHTKPFSCPECNRPFASLYSVKAHMETHKRGSQNLKHRCEVCGAIYARVFALRDHMKEQHPNEIVKSDSMEDLSIGDSLKNEAETSARALMAEEKQLSCSECNEIFLSTYLLKAHMDTHKKGNQTLKHRCSTCGAIYTRLYALQEHMNKFHGISTVEEEMDGNQSLIMNMDLNNENCTAAESIIPDAEEITLSAIENFQTEEIVTDLNYL